MRCGVNSARSRCVAAGLAAALVGGCATPPVAAPRSTPAPTTVPGPAPRSILLPPQSGETVAGFDYQRAIPRLPRPAGSPDPARRVYYARGESAMPLRARFAGAAVDGEALYRRLADGRFVAVAAPGFLPINTGCPGTTSGNPHARMIDLAAAEWAWFGFPVIDLTVAPMTAVPRGSPADPFEIIDPSRNAAVGSRVMRRATRLGLMEDDPEVRATIAGYWAGANHPDALRVQRMINFAEPNAGWAMPWSAAFVSWMACEAGLAPPSFRRSGSHVDYVRAAIHARDGLDASHAFIAFDLHEALPEPGDLLCSARAGASFTSLADVRARIGESHAMHCDLVVKTEPLRRRIHAIGGNVSHAVSLSMIASDAAGRPVVDNDVAGAARWFAILKPRHAGMRHTLDDTPTVLGLFQRWRGYSSATGSPSPGPLTPPAPAP